jgi:hypothetical protein
MKRETSLFLTLGLLSAIAPPVFAQDLQGRPDPVPPSSSTLGPQLIAWSELQKPEPVERPEQKPAKHQDQPTQKTTEPPAQSAQAEREPHSVSGNQLQAK